MRILAPSNEIPLFHCTKESMKYLARIIVYWTKSTSGPVFLLERSGNFTYYCCCTCLLVFQWLIIIMPSPMAMVSSPSSSHESYSLLSTLVFLWVWLESEITIELSEQSSEWVSGKLYLYLCCECHLNVWSFNELGQVRDWSASWTGSHICLRDSLSMNCVWWLSHCRIRKDGYKSKGSVLTLV